MPRRGGTTKAQRGAPGGGARRPASAQISERRIRSWMAATIKTIPTATPIHVSALEKNPLGLIRCHTLVTGAPLALSTTPPSFVHIYFEKWNDTLGSPVNRRPMI